MKTIETDYLVIGPGTTGLAFADTLISQGDAHVTIVDRRGKPRGHWNDADSFVTLHRPSAFRGLNSLALGSGRKDTAGLPACRGCGHSEPVPLGPGQGLAAVDAR